MRKQTEAFRVWFADFLAAQPSGSRLPTDSQIAQQHGLSRKTVEKIIRGFADSGRVVRRPGTGSFIAGGEIPISTSPLSSPLYSAQRLAGIIRQSLHAGEFQQGEALPSVKYIATRFRVSPATVVAAYRILRREELVVKTGKTFWFGRFERLVHTPSRKEIFLVVEDHPALCAALGSDHLAPAYHKMEQVLAAAGYILRSCFAGTFADIFTNRIPEKSPPYGLVLFHQTAETLSPLLPVLCRLREKYRSTKIPILCDWNAPPFNGMPGWIDLLSRPNLTTTIARTLAEWLTDRGRSPVALCINHDTLFGRKPYYWDLGDLLKVCCELRHRNPRIAVQIIITEAGEFADGTAFFEHYNHAFLESIITKYAHASRHDPASLFFPVDSLEHALRIRSRPRTWVFQKDIDAAAALDYFAARGQNVPRDISIISLDSEPAFFHRGLTRCEYDFDSMGYLMAHSIMRDFAVPRTTRGFIKTHARMVEKLTT